MKLSVKLTLIFLSLAIIPLICFSIFINYTIQTDTKKNSLETLSTRASQQKLRINNVLQQNQENLENIVNNNEIRILTQEYQENPNLIIQETLNSILTNVAIEYKNIFILDKKGTVIASTNQNILNVPYPNKTISDLSLRDNLIDMILDTEGSRMMFYSSPITIDTKTVGSIILETDTRSIDTIIKNYNSLGKTGETVLAKLNSEGKVVYIVPLRFDANAAFIRTTHDDKVAIVQAMKRIEKTTTESTDYRNTKVYSSSRYIDIAQWGLVVKKDMSEIFEHVLTLQQIFLLFAIFVSVVIIFIALYISHIIVHPIKQLIQFSKNISAGNFTQTIKISSKDEIGQLGNTFNLMSDKLNNFYKELEEEVKKRTKELEQTKISLETEVTKRTEQLQQAKANLEIEVAKRTSELHTKIDELETMNKTMINRELKMVDLKEQIQKLEEQLKNKG